MEGKNLADLYNRTYEAADVLHAQAAEIFKMAQELERLTKDTPAWYAGARARVEGEGCLGAGSRGAGGVG